jgi:hypothetical protein
LVRHHGSYWSYISTAICTFCYGLCWPRLESRCQKFVSIVMNMGVEWNAFNFFISKVTARFSKRRYLLQPLFQKLTSHLQIVGYGRVTWRKLRTENTQILGTMVQNSDTLYTWWLVIFLRYVYVDCGHL